MPDSDAARAYRIAVDEFRALGAAAPESIKRAVIFRDRTFVGQRFRCDGMQAVWIAGEETVTFYDCEGRLLKKVDMDAQPMKKVA